MPFKPSTTLDNIAGHRACGAQPGDRHARLRRLRHRPPRLADACRPSRSPACAWRRRSSHVELRAGRAALTIRNARCCAWRACTRPATRRSSGFNRAQAAVVEGAVLVSRLHMLPPEKIDAEMAYLQIAIDKTAGPEEHEAWGWLREAVAAHRAKAAVMTPDAAAGQRAQRRRGAAGGARRRRLHRPEGARRRARSAACRWRRIARDRRGAAQRRASRLPISATIGDVPMHALTRHPGARRCGGRLRRRLREGRHRARPGGAARARRAGRAAARRSCRCSSPTAGSMTALVARARLALGFPGADGRHRRQARRQPVRCGAARRAAPLRRRRRGRPVRWSAWRARCAIACRGVGRPGARLRRLSQRRVRGRAQPCARRAVPARPRRGDAPVAPA